MMKNKRFSHPLRIERIGALALAAVIGLTTVMAQGSPCYAEPETTENTESEDNASESSALQPGVSAETQNWTQSQIDDYYRYEEYIEINTAEDFMEFRQKCRSGLDTTKVYVILFADIDLSGEDFSGIESFSGRFDGNGYTISGINITGSSGAIGLFNYIEESGIVENLNVKIDIASDDSNNYVGGIAGVNAGLIYGCNVTGVLAGTGSTGGIAGVNGAKGVIGECTNYAVVNSLKSVGGIAGENRGWIYGCSNEGYVNADSDWLDYEDDSTFTLSLEGIITYVSDAAEDGSDIGGIAGLSVGDIEMCTNSGVVGYKHAGQNVGGIAGRFDGTIVYCINSGHVYGKKDVGGIAGQFEPELIGNGENVLKSSLNNMKNSGSDAIDNTLDVVADGLTAYSNGDYDEDIEKLQDSKDDVDKLEDAIKEEKDKLEDEKTDSQAALESNLTSMQDSLNDIANFITDKQDSLYNLAKGELAIEDYSALDPDNNKSSRISVCINEGQVNADRNVGGIAGNIGIEGTDSDDASLEQYNDAYETLAVLEYCQNEGMVVIRKENGGGITGYGNLGLIRGCDSTGAVYGEDANYLGNVAGQFTGTIDSCNAAGVIEGNNYLGGIAGVARRVRHCNSMSAITESSGWTGAILGDVYADYRDEDVSVLHTSMKDTIYDNCYVGENIFGIAGANYEGIAVSITYDEMLDRCGDKSKTENEQTDDLSIFSNLQVVFLDEEYDEISRTSVKYGDSLTDVKCPDYSTGDEDEYAMWSGYYSDTVVGNTYLVFGAETLVRTLQSEILDEESGKPVAYIAGKFTSLSRMTFEDVTDSVDIPSAANKNAGGQAYKVTVTNTYESDGSDIKIRVLNQDADAEVGIYVMKGEKWKKVSAELKGSYYEFAPGSSESLIYVQFVRKSKVLQYALIAAAAVSGILVLLWLGKKMTQSFKDFRTENKAE